MITRNKKLIIIDGIVTYPPARSNPKEVNKLFSNITKKQVLESIKASYGEDKDKVYYLKYASDYKPGDFTYSSCEKYDVLDQHYSIVLTYEGASGIYEKKITYTEIHGN